MVIVRRTLAVLVIIILGSIAAQELLKTISHLAPVLIILFIAITIGGGWYHRKRNRW